ncbi:gibberellin 2-beta-dioxygenase-like [Malania oleifera]|uniref:gibberellin 2-beta-dioxygenase-like n=1 Tax=Malania oleifera TaxID=397392 RepID=UPI0025AE375B|nr:gibberellin 2-beta-dioxygenase-like [Malania oleifera]
MVVLSHTSLESYPFVQTCKSDCAFPSIPEIDLTNPHAGSHVVKACEAYGFFKVINHGVSMDLIAPLESQALKFFSLPQSEKENAGPADPFGYGSKRIGANGDVGWVEYLFFSANHELTPHKPIAILDENPQILENAVNEYVSAVKAMACHLLELIADGLEIEPRDVFSRLLKDEKSDSLFRMNHYPPCPELQALSLSGLNLVGFGEHTDPQLISVARSNNTTGLQISLSDGTWVSVPPDQTSFFINVGDSLQVMTNNRFKSVKHRVFADSTNTRVSMIYFGGPPPHEKIASLPSLLKEGEESMYNEFTWSEYKEAAFRTRLGDNRLGPFEKKAAAEGH